MNPTQTSELKRIFWKRLLLTALAGLGLLLLHHWIFVNGRDMDPDRYFHIAVSRLAAEQGHRLDSLPQVEGLGWGRKFPDKEYLFHVLTSAAYRIGGEQGVLAVIPFLGAALFASLAFIITHWLSGWMAVPAILAVGLNSYFLMRVLMLRPHVLAILVFVWFVYFLVRRKPLALAALGALYALSYHAVYVPAIVLAIYCIAYRSERRLCFGLFAAGVGGLALGALLNPYFPESLGMGFQHIRIGLLAGGTAKNTAHLDFGSELTEMSARNYLILFRAQFVCLGFALFHFLRRGKEEESQDPRELQLLALLAILFWGITFLNRRGSEYSVPLTAFLLARCLAGWEWRKGLAAGAVLCMIVGLQLPLVTDIIRKESSTLYEKPKRILAAIDRIPPEARGQKVFNTSWASAPYLLYRRPDLRFIDILDPSFLLEADERKFSYRALLRKGSVSDAYSLVRNSFGASYVLTGESIVIDQLESDPNFRRLHPSSPPMPGEHSLYAVAESRVPNQALNFEFAPIPESFRGDLVELKPGPDLRWSALSGARPAPLVNLFSGSAPRQKGRMACSFIRPAAEEIRRHAGASWIGAGGGERVKLWVNGKPLLSDLESAARPRTVRVWAPLTKPLEKSDRIEALVCSGDNATYLGLGLSFWNAGELRAWCDRKSPGSVALSHDRGDDARAVTLAEAEKCLGRRAIPSLKGLEGLAQAMTETGLQGGEKWK